MRTTTKATGFLIRWMIRRDMDDVLQIENAVFKMPWLEEKFKLNLRNRWCIGMVIELNDNIVGYMIYELHKKEVRILNFAVAPEYQRCGAGTAMADRLIGKLSSPGRDHLSVEVRETNMAAQLFFKHAGFKAVFVLRDFYGDEDAYLMQYCQPGVV